MTRIVSYNILVGATRRVNQLTKIIRPVHPDIVGLVEATNPQVVEELAKRLEMQYVMSGHAQHTRDWQVAVLSSLPIVETQIHISSGVLMKPVLQVCVEEADGQQLTVFVTHLTAAFNQGWAGERIRRREMQELLRIMALKQGTPHLLMGDFNALAPGDAFKASLLLRYVVKQDQLRRQNAHVAYGDPHLNFVVPPQLRVFNPLLRLIARSRPLYTLFDAAASLYAPRGSINLLSEAGYVDCYRRMNPDAWGFTCPASSPAGRIDFIFASPELAERLSASHVVTEGEGLRANEASDHRAVVAEFGESISKGGMGSSWRSHELPMPLKQVSPLAGP